MKKWCFLLAALFLLPVSACGSGEDDSYLRGQVTEVVLGTDGLPDTLVLDTGDGKLEGVFWDEETQWALPPVAAELTAAEVWEDPLGMEVSVDLRPDVEGKPLTAQDGTEIPDAGTADFLTVEEIRSSESLTLSDGTQAEIWVGFWNDRSYRLPDGTELLRESPPETDFSGYCVEGDTSLTELSPALAEGINTYYQERGALYDIQAEVEKAYQAALKNEIGSQGRIAGAGKLDVGQFVSRGGWSPYIAGDNFAMPQDGSQFSASHTLEYSFSSYAVAQWAKALGQQEDYEQLMELSKGWEKLFDDATGFIRPRTPDGRFIDNFNPYEPWRGFQEGNAMQYTFFVPQDPYGLIEKVGQDEFNHRLDSIFVEARKSVFGGGKVTYAFSGLQSPYNHGNQPCLHIPWLFNFSGKPYLTQKWTRLICDEFYGTDAEHGYGYGQDEDQGQLGAWYVLAATGLFDVQGGASTEPTFQIGSPQFDKIEISLSPVNASARKFVIKTEGNSPEAMYVQSAELDGKSLDRNWIYRSDVYDGGILTLHMGTEPSETWGTSTPPPYAR